MIDDAGAMALALAEARAAGMHDDVPIGAVVILEGELLSARHNERERLGDPTAHAEVLALSDAARALGPVGLDRCTLVVTLEPCVMCAGAARAAGVARIVFGAFDPKAGACGSRYNLAADVRLGPDIELRSGLMAEESAGLLTAFFALRR